MARYWNYLHSGDHLGDRDVSDTVGILGAFGALCRFYLKLQVEILFDRV